jgi:hypothetical protein
MHESLQETSTNQLGNGVLRVRPVSHRFKDHGENSQLTATRAGSLCAFANNADYDHSSLLPTGCRTDSVFQPNSRSLDVAGLGVKNSPHGVFHPSKTVHFTRTADTAGLRIL